MIYDYRMDKSELQMATWIAQLLPKSGKFDLQFWIEAGGAYNRYVMYLCQYQIFKARYLGVSIKYLKVCLYVCLYK